MSATFAARAIMKMYFPLRSNVDYRALQPLELDLESRIKLAALLFDELVFENGAIFALVGKTKAFDLRAHDMSQVPEEMREGFESDDGVFEVRLGEITFEDEAVRRYYLGYHHLLDSTGLGQLDWVHLSPVELRDNAKNAVDAEANRLYGRFDFDHVVSRVLFLNTIKHLLHDSLVASASDWQLNLDPLHFTLHQQISMLEGSGDSSSRPLQYEQVFPDIPDMRQIRWEDILEARERSAVREMRDAVRGMSAEMMSAELRGETGIELNNQLKAWGYDQLMAELPHVLPNPGERVGRVALSLGMNAVGQIPGLGLTSAIASGVLDTAAAFNEQRTSSQTIAAAFVRRRKDQEEWG